MAYAVLRYNIFQAISFEHLPLYVTNKALALSIVVLIFFRLFTKKENHAFYDITIYAQLLMHVFISLALLSPAYYPKFFLESKINITGELSLLFGVTALVMFLMRLFVRQHKKFSSIKLPISVVLFLVSAHVFSMGISGWITPLKWSGYLPPISLIAFVILITTVLKKSRM